VVEKEIFLSGKVILMTTHMLRSPRQFATLVAVIFVLTPVSLEASIMSQLGKLRALFGKRGVPAQTVPSAPIVPVPQPVAAEPAPAPPLPPPPPPEIYPDPSLQWPVQESVDQSVTLEGRYLIEAAGVTVQNPPISAGSILKSDTVGAYLVADSKADWAGRLSSGRHYFLEVTGPNQHPWAGHRLEIDEDATRAVASNQIRWEPQSLRNSRVPDTTLAGATFQVRPHVTLAELFATSWEHRWRYQPSASPIGVSLGRPGQPPLELEIRAGSNGAGISWISGGQPVATEDLIVAPGSGFVVRFTTQPGLGSGLAGETRAFPCRAPLIAGWNLLSYPYPKDLRFGIDWPYADPKSTASSDPLQADRLVTFSGGVQKEYGLWAAPQGPRWRMVNRGTSLWQDQVELLEKIPTGYGFFLYRIKPNPHHAFLPPTP